MATKTKRVGLLVVAAVVAIAAVPPLRNGALDLFGLNGGTELIGTGETQFMVASSAASHLDKCTPQQGLADQQCDDLKFIMIDAARMPFIARNISTAWIAGKPGVLTKNSAKEAANRKQVCLPSFPRLYGGTCDEYPFAGTSQGGAGAQEQEVPARENNCQGGTLSTRYRAGRISDGDRTRPVPRDRHREGPELRMTGPTFTSDLEIEISYGQVYIYADPPWADDPENDAVLRALDDARESGRFVGTADGLLDLIAPVHSNFHAPMRIEVWPAEPLADDDDWDHVVDIDLGASGGQLNFEASGGRDPISTDVPAGEYRVRVCGRGYTAAAGGAEGMDSYRLQLWPRTENRPPDLRRNWEGWATVN